MVYFIQGEFTKKIKIGFTNSSIEVRMQPMKSSSADKLLFLGGVSGNRALEKSIQYLFKRHHSHGEWYIENEDIYKYINDNCIIDIECLQIVNEEVLNERMSFSDGLALSMTEIKKIQLDRIRDCAKDVMLNSDKSISKLSAKDSGGMEFKWVYNTTEYLERWYCQKGIKE